MRRAAGLLVAITACGPAAPEPIEEGRSDIVGGRIQRGIPAVGALTYDGAPECTGTLIAPRRVLTAAHCLEDVEPWTLGFVTGPDAYAPQAGAGVVAAFPHPDYDPDTVEHDLAWVLLGAPLSTRPLGVVEEMDEDWIGRSLLFVGYGNTSSDGDFDGRKRSVSMEIDDVYETDFWYGSARKNVCDGDSGGPALHRTASGEYLIAGVTSTGDEYCEEFGVSMRVDPYLDFLELEASCRGETFAGRCEGRTLVYCDGRVQRIDCDDACGWIGDGFDCTEEVDDPCAGETLFGRCDGDTLVWCDGDGVRTDTCSRCGLAGPAGFDCL